MFGAKKPPIEAVAIEKILDPTTGETIHRYSIPPEVSKDIEKSINVHSQTMNQFVQNSCNFFDLLDIQIELKRKVKIADENVKVSLTKAIKDCKLDSKLPWQWNMLLKTFEYRTAPIVEGMTKEEVEASTNPVSKPKIVDTPGIAVK